MLRSLKDLEHYGIAATDGDVGSVVNFLLDDQRWAVRYMVAETGSFFTERRVLISPVFLGEADWATRSFHLSLTKDKVKNSPGVDLDKPVSRQHERDYYRYYGYPYYWGYSGLWGVGAYPSSLQAGQWSEPSRRVDEETGDAHLRSANELRGYHIQGTDEGVGHVDDFIVDDESWAIRYLVIDTSNWWFGKKVLVAPDWASRISWAESKVFVGMTRQEIKDSPEWQANEPINRQYESRLYDYYGRPAYWDTQAHAGQPPPQHTDHHPA